MTLNVAMILEYAARQVPDKIYLTGDPHFTFSQLEAEARRFASALAALGVQPGEKILLILPNIPTFLSCYYGILKLGAVPVPVNVTSPGPEIAYFITNSGATVLVAYEPYIEAALEGFKTAGSCRHFIIANLPDSDACPESAHRLADLLAITNEEFPTGLTRAEDPAAILYTGGTTGRPKGAVLTHLNHYFINQFLAHDFWQLTADDVILMVAPAAHVFGLTMINVACIAQAQLSLIARFEPEVFLRAIERDKATFFAGVPTLAHFMLHAPQVNNYDLSSLRRVMFAGAPLHPEIAKQFQERFHVDVITGYGMTEGTCISFLNAEMYKQAPIGSVGVPASGTTVRVVNEAGHDLPRGEIGEIVARGPQMCIGYYNRPDETAAAWRDEWFHTGDAGYMDEDGYIFLVDRLKDLIKRSGYSVSPAEVERVLHAHPAVAETAVVGISDEALGEEIKAFVTLKPNATVSAEELIEYSKQHLAAYKYPRLIEFRDSLPKSTAGKILRRALREE